MGTYRYQGQQDGKLRDCNTQTQKVQDWRTEDWQTSKNWQTQEDWQTQQGQQAQDRQGARRWLKQAWFVGLAMKNLSLVVTGGLALVSLVALVGVWRSGSEFIEDIYARFTAPQPDPKIDMQPVLVQQLRSASELTTAVFAMQTVVPTSRDRTLGGYVIGRTTLLYIAYGEVRAGVDLSALKPEDVQVNGESISVRLPPPRILDRKIDVTRSQVYDYDRGFLGLGPDAAPELQDLAEQVTLQEVVEAACSQGLLQTANDRAKLTVSQLLSTAGYTTPSIETQPPSPEACPAANLPKRGEPTSEEPIQSPPASDGSIQSPPADDEVQAEMMPQPELMGGDF